MIRDVHYSVQIDRRISSVVCQEEFDVLLKGEDMRKANTPAELYEIVKSKM